MGRISWRAHGSGVRIARRLCGLGAAGTLLAFGAAPATAIAPGPNGPIAFESGRTGNSEIFRMSADGTDQVNLTNHPAADVFPAWSPDASRITFSSDRHEVGNADVYVMSATGTDVTQLTDSPGEDRGTSWTSDGEVIVFHTERDAASPHRFDVFKMNADGSDETLVVPNGSAAYVCGTSADGVVAFNSAGDLLGTNPEGDFEIYTVDLDGANLRQLTSNAVLDSGPKWSPDCSSISYNSDDSGSLDVHRMAADGSGDVNLTNSPGVFDAFSAWSPDGRRIVFTSASAGDFEVYTMDADDGGNVERLTFVAGADLRSDWATVPACDVAAGAVGCWRFGEAAGATALDASGFANHGGYVGGPVLGVPGAVPPDTAASLDGNDDHVVVPDAPSLDVGDSFTFEGWILRDSDRRTHQLVNKGGRGLHLVVMDRFNGNQVWLRKAGVSTIVRTSTGVPADGRFHHVVATKDGPDSTRIYIDGTAQPLQPVSPNQLIEDTAARLFFSATPSGTPIGGDIDEFALYDRALTEAEVTDRFERGGGSGAAALTGADGTGARATADSRDGSRAATGGGGGGKRACADAGDARSGITGLHATKLNCERATDLATAGPAKVEEAGFDCVITDEDFSGPVVRITRDCRTKGDARLTYTTRS